MAAPAQNVSASILETLPPRVDRRTGAELVTRFFFPIHPRTLEKWPLTNRRINKRAIVETSELFAHAQSIVDSTPVIRGGRSKAA